jgi:hypothetical protein
MIIIAIIEEAVCRVLEIFILADKRSRFINDALRRELKVVRCKVAVGKMIGSRSKGRKFTNHEITEGRVMDRRSH